MSRYCEIFAIIFFVMFLGEKLAMFRFVKGNNEKKFENHWFRPSVIFVNIIQYIVL